MNERKEITYETVRKSDEIRTYIKQADESLKALGFTEHAFAHCTKCAIKAGEILKKTGYSDRDVELAMIAGFMHDIGNVVNRADHAQSGAIMAFRILDNMGMSTAGQSTKSDLEIDKDAGNITLKLKIDTHISPVIDYFEIFMNRMLLCKKAAAFFNLRFKLVINGSELL